MIATTRHPRKEDVLLIQRKRERKECLVVVAESPSTIIAVTRTGPEAATDTRGMILATAVCMSVLLQITALLLLTMVSQLFTSAHISRYICQLFAKFLSCNSTVPVNAKRVSVDPKLCLQEIINFIMIRLSNCVAVLNFVMMCPARTPYTM